MNVIARALGLRVHYAWVVVAAVFFPMVASAGVRSMPGVLLVPLETDLGWDRSVISFAAAVGIALYGLMGPFAASIMLRFGIRLTVLTALALLCLSVAATTLVDKPWQMVVVWGVLTGLGSGTIASVLGATIVGRWFRQRRGLAMGLLTASTVIGQLVFLPVVAALIDRLGWRHAMLAGAVAPALAFPVIWLLLPESPASIGLRPYGASGQEDEPPVQGNPLANAFRVLGQGVRVPAFWLLFGSFFICGFSTTGLVGTHMIAFCVDHGLPEMQAAGLVATMGVLNLLGTTASGWMSDRYDNRMLLAWYYGLRGLSLLYLPLSDFDLLQLSVFGIFYGLDWIATVPPTVRLIAQSCGESNAAILYGWIAVGHQVGAGIAAYGAAWSRDATGSYFQAFVIAGVACLAVASAFVWTLVTGGLQLRRETS